MFLRIKRSPALIDNQTVIHPTDRLNKPLLFSTALALAVWLIWYAYSSPDSLSIIEENWTVTLTMVFGSFIAGATSEGGGAVAFPVFTKVLHIAPLDAKVFSLAIQSVGMTAASLTIIALRVPVAWPVIAWASLGGLVGVSISSTALAPLLPPALLKMLFTAMIAAFALPLTILTWQKRLYNDTLPFFGAREKAIWLLTGTVGGGMTGLVGSGIDIICFSVMVLWFRLSEKVSTPTSVILMAVNALAGFALHGFLLDSFNATVERYWLAAVPVVVIGAPLGAYCCTKLNSRAIAVILILLILVELLSSLILIPLTANIIGISLTVFVIFLWFYYRMARSTRYRPACERGEE
ncbi:sulfite exporter TauE/SafE family protein [Methylotuvimicrobium alcaliphilum]|uniref:Probable membrane transporter protein n=1 Tax=Methylotuvimicrobium alcaliphilum (strain DSM 19304 / NCIMB 14124 / VKM B-2133 / 20Z) TaxID=1091494 RepID=G4SXF5_META2|nr:sulfite exporter TauE/SafE family protein [Methylotuvimicrobium alcaliphilum]CCE25319.1 Permease [Methylotuvimicrobium alcaliphilum 20Z]